MSKKKAPQHVGGMTAYLRCRLSKEAYEEFITKTEEIGKSQSEFLREMVIAFNEDRLRIQKPKTKSKVYVN